MDWGATAQTTPTKALVEVDEKMSPLAGGVILSPSIALAAGRGFGWRSIHSRDGVEGG
jgi:hypothetical protein